MISASRFQVALKSLNGMAQKVYAAVPIAAPWSMSYIHSEMQRLGSSTRDVRVVGGCLQSLKDAGLVLEPQSGLFIRAAVKPEVEKPAKVQQPTKESSVIQQQEKPMRSPMAILSDLAVRCKQLADDLETAALEIDEHITAKSAGAEKLAQLQQLLKSLG